MKRMIHALPGTIIGSFLAFVLMATLSRAIDVLPGGAIPSGGIIAVDVATCPSGYAEVTAARGRHLVGMPGAGTILGTVGTAMTDTQNLSVTPTFTGSALATHQHKMAWGRDTATARDNFDYTRYGTSGTFTGLKDPSGAGAPGVSDEALSQGISGGTPAGTNSAVTGGDVAPYIQILLCKKS